MAAFDPSLTNLAHVEVMSSTVFKITSNGRSYALRIDEPELIEYSLFAHQFFADSPRRIAPLTRRLTNDELKAMIFSTAWSENVSTSLARKLQHAVDSGGLHCSITPWIDAPNGMNLARESPQRLLHLALQAAINHKTHPPSFTGALINFRRVLAQTDVKSQEQFILDLKAIHSHERTLTPKNIATYIEGYIRSLSDSQIKTLRNKICDDLPKKIRKDLADGTALSFLIGFNDLYTENWVYSLTEQRAKFIDLATPKKHLDTLPREQPPQTPFGAIYNNEADFIHVLHDVSPETRTWISELDASTIRDIAKRTGLELTPIQISKILERRQILLHTMKSSTVH